MPSAFKHADSDGVTLISSVTWPTSVAGDTLTAKKFGIRNIASRTLGSPYTSGVQLAIAQNGISLGYQQLRIGLDTATLSSPWNLAAVVSAGAGVWGSIGTYGWVIVAVNGTGVTGPSLEVTFEVTAVGDSVALTWDAVPGATSYRAYRTSTPGTYGSTSLVYSGGTPGFTDTGAAPSSGSVPTMNTTGGAGPNYGTPPALSTTPILLATSLYVGMDAFYWVNRIEPVTTPEELYSGLILPSEI